MSSANYVNGSATTRPTECLAGIIVAMPEELATLTKSKLSQGEWRAIGDNILVFHAGAGPANAERAAHVLIKNGVNRLISWGCAAALSEDFKPGDLLAPAHVLSEDGTILETDPGWLEHLRRMFAGNSAISFGTLTESSVIVALADEKRRIRMETETDALDMETAAIFKVAKQANLPCLAIRAIADPANMDLPPAIVHSMNSQGGMELFKLLFYLPTHPSEIPALIKLGLHFNAASRTLKTVAKQVQEIVNFKKINFPD